MAYMKDKTGRRLDSFEVADTKALLRALRKVADAFPPLATNPPAVTWNGPGGASPISNAQSLSYRTDRVRMLGFLPTYNDASQFVTNGINAGGPGKCWTMEADHYGTDFVLILRDGDGSITDRSVWVWVDDAPLTPGLAGATGVTASSGASFRLRLNWATPGRHRIRVVVRGPHSFRGVEIGPTDSVSKPPRPRLRVVMLGDSYIDGANFAVKRTVADGVTNSTTTITSATAAFVSTDKGSLVTGAGIPDGAYIATITNSTTAVLSVPATATASAVSLTILNNGAYDVETWPQIVGRMLGGAEVFQAGQGGTGYMNPATTGKAPYGDAARLAALDAVDVNLIVIAGSVNDDASNGYSYQQVFDAASAVFAHFATTKPGVPIIVAGPQATGTASTTSLATAWAASAVITTGALTLAGGSVYYATAGGTTAASGSGPTGTGASISDGTVTWKFIGVGTGGRFIAVAAVKAAAAAAPNVLGFIDPVGALPATLPIASGVTYAVGDTCVTQGAVLRCLVSHTTASTTPDMSKWDRVSWLDGTGYSLFPSGAGNRDLLLSNDQVHLTKPGHVYYALRTIHGIAALLPAK